MKILIQILMVVSAVALILSALMGFELIKTEIWNLDGRDFCLLALAITLYAIALGVLKPFGGGGGSEE